MKNLFPFLLLTSSFPVEGQLYLNESSMWKERSGYHKSYPDPYYYVEDYVIKLDGDTVIDSRLYYKTLKTGTLTVTGGTPDTLVGIYPIHNYLKPLREENKDFYMYNLQTKKDEFLHNFDLVIGDTATTDCDYAFVTWIDTLYLGNIPRKRFHLAFPPGKGEVNSLIEGVGAAWGLFLNPCNVYPPFTTYFKLQCYSQDGAYMQVDSTFDCSNVVHSNDHIHQYPFSIRPNPIDEYLEIYFPEQIMQDLKVTIMNLTGAVIYQKNFKSSDKIERISFLDVPSGLYIISLKSKDAISAFKIIKR